MPISTQAKVNRVEKLEENIARKPCKKHGNQSIFFEGGDYGDIDKEKLAEIQRCRACKDRTILVINFGEFARPPKPEPTFNGHLTIGDGDKMFGEE